MPETCTLDASSTEKIKLYDDKQYVKSLLNKKIYIGKNWINVCSVTQKYVIIEEFQRGVHQRHCRYNLSNAADYIRYRKEIMSVSISPEIEESIQSYEWKTLNRTIEETRSDIESQIYSEKSISKLEETICVQFLDTSIVIGFENGEELEIILRKESALKPFALTIPLSFNTIVTHQDFTRFDFAHRIFSLIYNSCNSTKSSIFAKNIHSLMDISERFKSVEIVQPVLSTQHEHQRVINWIQNSEVNQPMILQIGVFGINGNIYKRFIKVEKITRVRTQVQVIALSDTDSEKIEWSSHISKISQNLKDNSEKILQIRTSFIID
jgi:hypothetical protein